MASERYDTDRDYRDQIDLVRARSATITALIDRLVAVREQFGDLPVAAIRDSNGQLCVVEADLSIADGVAAFDIDD